MNVNGIGATGYPAAGYETRRTERNVAGRNFADAINKAAPGVCQMERGRGIHHPARHHCKDTFRLLAAGAAGLHRPDLFKDHEPFL